MSYNFRLVFGRRVGAQHSVAIDLAETQWEGTSCPTRWPAMTAGQASLIAVAYGYVYHFLARGSIARIMDVDPDYKERWTRPSLGANPKNSLAILYIMFNMNLPKESYPESLQWRIWIARVMLWLWPFVIFATVYFGRD